MTDTDYPDLPLRMETLIKDAIGQIVSHEDAQGFITWMRVHIQDYYTGPNVQQGRLFPDVATTNPEQVIMDPEMLRALGVTLASMIWNSTPLPPLFDGNIRKTGDDAEYALTLLCNALDDLGHKKKKIALLQKIIDTVPRSPLRSGAWQRLATIRMDNGDVDGAWEAFQHGQRDDPGSTGLGLLEVQILNAQGQNEKAGQRADFWVRQMRRAGMMDDDPPLAFMIEVARDPMGAFTDFGLESVDDAGLLLKQWLESGQDRPVPEYTIGEEVLSAGPGGDDGMSALRKQLSSHGMDEEQIRQALDDLQNELDDPVDDKEDDLVEEGFLSAPPMKSLQPPPGLDKLELEWHGIYPLEKPFSVHETPTGGDDPWGILEEEAWAGWLQDHPAPAPEWSGRE